MAELDYIREENEALKKSLEASTTQLANARIEMEELRKVCSSQKDLWMELEDLRQTHDQLQAEFKSQTDELENNLSKMKLLEEQSTLKDRAMEKLSAQLSHFNKLQTEQAMAKSSEVGILLMKLEDAHAEIQELKQANEELLSKNTKIPELSTLQAKLSEVTNAYEEAIRERIEMEKTAVSLNICIKEHEEKDLELRTNFEHVKKELESIKACEFSGISDQANLTIEQLINLKNRKLETEIVHLRLYNEEIEKLRSGLEIRISELEHRQKELEETIEKYENFDTETISFSSPTSTDGSMSPEKLISMLNNQRDRLKRRNQELEKVSILFAHEIVNI